MKEKINKLDKNLDIVKVLEEQIKEKQLAKQKDKKIDDNFKNNIIKEEQHYSLEKKEKERLQREKINLYKQSLDEQILEKSKYTDNKYGKMNLVEKSLNRQIIEELNR